MKKKILVIDDEATNIKILYNFLEDYTVLAATSGEKGVKTAISQQPDIVLLDIIMPGMDGYEVLHQLRENEATKEIPVIFLTGLDCAENEEYGLKLGASDYITKPFNMNVVEARLATHLKIVEQKKTIEFMANHDFLTGIPNRQYIHELFNQVCLKENKIALLYMDLDHFKSANDQYGHDAGDAILKEIVSRVQDILAGLEHQPNYIGRVGGDEFILIMSNVSSIVQLSANCEQLLQKIEEPIVFDDKPIHISASIGGLFATSDMKYADLVSKADELMYKVKREGRGGYKV